MSEIDNLEFIRDNGIRKFVDRERRRWISEKGVFCVHDKQCYKWSKHNRELTPQARGDRNFVYRKTWISSYISFPPDLSRRRCLFSVLDDRCREYPED